MAASVAIASQPLFQGWLLITGVDGDTTTWRVTGTYFDYAMVGFAAGDCAAGDVVYSGSRWGDSDLFLITNVYYSAGNDLIVDVVYDEIGTPRAGAPQPGLQIICRRDVDGVDSIPSASVGQSYEYFENEARTLNLKYAIKVAATNITDNAAIHTNQVGAGLLWDGSVLTTNGSGGGAGNITNIISSDSSVAVGGPGGPQPNLSVTGYVAQVTVGYVATNNPVYTDTVAKSESALQSLPLTNDLIASTNYLNVVKVGTNDAHYLAALTNNPGWLTNEPSWAAASNAVVYTNDPSMTNARPWNNPDYNSITNPPSIPSTNGFASTNASGINVALQPTNYAASANAEAHFVGIDATLYAVQNGPLMQNATNISIGVLANGSVNGTAIGYLADGNWMGVAVGFNTKGFKYGVGIGNSTTATNEGVGIGDGCNGNNWGTAIGAQADAWTYGVAVGDEAWGVVYGTAIGAKSSAVSNSVAIGYGVANAEPNSTMLKGNLNMQGNTVSNASYSGDGSALINVSVPATNNMISTFRGATNNIISVFGGATNALNTRMTNVEVVASAALPASFTNTGIMTAVKVTGLSGPGTVPVGAIMDWWATNAPPGWLVMQGQVVSTNTYSNLYASAVGQLFVISGTNMIIPNCQGKVFVGLATNGTFNSLGKTGGAETVTLDTTQIPAHSHPPPAGIVDFWGWNGGAATVAAGGGSGLTSVFSATGNTGGGLSHENMPPYVVVNRIIKY